MAYIGPLPAETFTSFATQEFSTSATTSYTLDHPVTNENELALFINNVRQQPGSGKAYTASGTALTLSAATASTDTMYAVFLGRALQTVNPADASVGASQLASNAVTNAKVASDAAIATTKLGAGAVLQVVSTAKSDTYSESVGANTMSSTDITGLSASITPTSSSNKILIIASLATGRNSNDTNSGVGIAMFRGGSLVGVGDTASSRTRLSSMSHHASDVNITTVPINFLDSPSTTSSTTYTFRFLNSDGDTSNLYLNRSANDADGSHIGRCISTVTLMEISA